MDIQTESFETIPVHQGRESGPPSSRPPRVEGIQGVVIGEFRGRTDKSESAVDVIGSPTGGLKLCLVVDKVRFDRTLRFLTDRVECWIDDSIAARRRYLTMVFEWAKSAELVLQMLQRPHPLAEDNCLLAASRYFFQISSMV